MYERKAIKKRMEYQIGRYVWRVHPAPPLRMKSQKGMYVGSSAERG